MGTKKCAYYGCESFSKPTCPSAETFFAFPRDPVRCKLWMELGGCREPIPCTMRYFCSKHFDESKYVAYNQRRKQLLSSAIPWAYNQSEQKVAVVDDVDDYQCVASTIVDNDDDDEDVTAIERFHEDTVSVEATNDITGISDTIEEALQNYVYDDSNEFTIALSTDKKHRKRKYESTSSKRATHESDDLDAGPSNHKIISNRATSSTIIATIDEERARELKLMEDLGESMVLESSNLTTFIFKGQEYIQMPKDEYVGEKMSLLQKIKSYEEILKNVKHLVDGVSI